MGNYADTYARWQDDPIGFWAEAAKAIAWASPWHAAFNPDHGVYGRWFAGATCNTCYNALDRHVEAGRGEQTAVIYDSPVTGTKRTISYRELRDDVATFAAVLADHGIAKGDRVIIYMPMIPEAIVAMLACARPGRDPLGRLRRLRRPRTGQPHQRRPAEAAGHRLLRHRAEPHRSLSAAGQCCDRSGHAQAGDGDRRPARPAPRRTRSGARPRLCRGDGEGARRRAQRDLGRRGRDRPALHPLHLRHDRPAQGHHPRQWRPHGRARMVDGERLRRRAGRGLSGRRRTSAGWSATPTSSMRRSFTAVRAYCTRASRWARPMPAPSGG